MPPRRADDSGETSGRKGLSLAGVVFATFTGNLFLAGGSLIMSTIALLVSWIPPRTEWTFVVARLWARNLLRASCVRLEASYDPALDPGASYVFLANHQSLYDIPVLLASAPGPLRLMAKRSLFRIPVFGWAMAAGGFIPVDRQDRSTARESFAAAAARLRAGTSILIFPEGTRTQTGELLPFQRGGILLALKSGLPIVPVGIRGTLAVQPGGNWAIRPGRAVVRYGAPLAVAEYGIRRKRELTEEVRRRVAELAGVGLGDSEPGAPGDGGSGEA